MDSDHYTCGTCRHGNLQDNCGQCEKDAAELMREYEALNLRLLAAANYIDVLGGESKGFRVNRTLGE